MKKVLFISILCAGFFSLPSAILADVVITVDGMFLNGKIIEDVKNNHVRLANYHGIFTIRYVHIRKLYRTGGYREDVVLLRNMGRSVDESAVKKNYDAGMKKLGNSGGGKRPYAGKNGSLSTAPFFEFTAGRIRPVLPWSAGMILSGELFRKEVSWFGSDGLAAELRGLAARKGEAEMMALSAGLGPVWRYSPSFLSSSMRLVLSPSAGAGYYSVKGRSGDSAGVKFHAVLAGGPEFRFSSMILSPRLRLSCVFDNEAPLIGIGVSLTAGMLF
jgi:hypothetical protein